MFWLRQTRQQIMSSLFNGSTMSIFLSKNLVIQKPMNYNPSLKRGLWLMIIPTIQPPSAVSIKEGQDKLLTLYWLPKLYKRPYKAWYIANSSSCTTTELSKLLTSCLTAIRKHVIKYCDKIYERSGKNLFWSIKNSNEVLNKLKSRSFRAPNLSTYDFSTLYTTSAHNLIKEKLNDFIEWTFTRESSLYLACNGRNYFSAAEKHRNYTLWSFQEVCEALTFLLDNI